MDIILSKLRALNLAEPIGVVGMGVSGMAALDVLREAGYDASGFDEHKSARHIQQVNLDEAVLSDCATLVVSPGIDRRRAAFTQTFAPCINDIELFARVVDKPVVAVTGSNGKSTVVTLMAAALESIGHQVCLCGNIGRAVMDALLESQLQTDYFVLELSSYQLELCPSLHPTVGAVLNVTPDHLNRYDSLHDYYLAKANLAKQSQQIFLNADDPFCRKMGEVAINPVYFGSKAVESNRVGEQYLYISDEKVIARQSLALTGKHNHSNALCVLLMLQALNEPIEQALTAIAQFDGLDHRMQTVRESGGVKWVNDSKATNIGATAAALAGLQAPVVLIVGGDGKQQDFHELARIINQSTVKAVLVIGEDSKDITAALKQHAITYCDCKTLAAAIGEAASIAIANDIVLLSPACASFDQFDGFEHRGDCFQDLVKAL